MVHLGRGQPYVFPAGEESEDLGHLVILGHDGCGLQAHGIKTFIKLNVQIDDFQLLDNIRPGSVCCMPTAARQGPLGLLQAGYLFERFAQVAQTLHVLIECQFILAEAEPFFLFCRGL